MPTEIDLDTNSPFDPERVLDLAEVIAQATRCLNHATIPPDYQGMGFPVLPDRVIDELAEAANRSVQLYGQLADALGARFGEEDGRVVLAGGQDGPAAGLAGAQIALIEAAGLAQALASVLATAKVSLNGLYWHQTDGN